MRILVVGASGFIGRRIVEALRAAGHYVIRGLRSAAPGANDAVAIDFDRPASAKQWLSSLAGVDAVVNAVGIVREVGGQRFARVHETGPQALFQACEAAGVAKVIQISALGADSEARSRFHFSKRSADDFLARRALDWVIVQPSLVFGFDGASARLFALLASLPVVPVPGDGGQRVQPIHVDDLAALVVRLIEGNACNRTRIAAVGPRAVTLREWLGVLRAQMGLSPARHVNVPLPLVRAVIGAEILGMLLRGNTAGAEDVRRCLGRIPRAVEQFVSGAERSALAMRARLDWLLPVLRMSIALVWILSGVVSLGLYPVSDSLGLLERVGLTGAAALTALYGGALLDIALGAAVYLVKCRRWRRWMWRLQIAVMLGYTALITLFLPELWLHPFGPLLKNVPMLAATLLLHEMEGTG